MTRLAAAYLCSLLHALGETPPVAMAEMDHADPALALKVYAQAVRRDEPQQAHLGALVEGVVGPIWANGMQTTLNRERRTQ